MTMPPPPRSHRAPPRSTVGTCAVFSAPSSPARSSLRSDGAERVSATAGRIWRRATCIHSSGRQRKREPINQHMVCDRSIHLQWRRKALPWRLPLGGPGRVHGRVVRMEGCSSSVLVCNVCAGAGTTAKATRIEMFDHRDDRVLGGLASSERVAGSIITIHISHGTIP